MDRTCLIGIRLMDGVICPSTSRWRELCITLPMSDCELVGAFELESADCGEVVPFGRLFVPHGFISRAELTLG